MTDKQLAPITRIYEHPFNERMRLLLRLEIIFAQAIAHKQARDQYETQMCLDALFALLNITHRYELRAELLRELERIKNLLVQLQRTEQASNTKVTQTLEELTSCVKSLHRLDSKHIDSVRNIEFLNTVKNRNVHDTGSYLFELPALQYWLLQDAALREQQIQAWLDDFTPLKSSVDFLLRLIRDSAEQETICATSGVYIKTVDGRSSSHQLLRIILPETSVVFPRVSGDKFRFAIRFMAQTHVDTRASQSNQNIDFILQACGI